VKLHTSLTSEAPPSICQNAGTMSSQLNWASATIFVRTKTETIDDRNTSEGVETKLRTLFLILRAQGVWN
jgi:hypothetical protein